MITRGTSAFAKGYGRLRSRHGSSDGILDSVREAIEDLQNDRDVKKSVMIGIPAHYRRQYGVTNVFRKELRRGWRMMYTILSLHKARHALMLNVFNHDRYDATRKNTWRPGRPKRMKMEGMYGLVNGSSRVRELFEDYISFDENTLLRVLNGSMEPPMLREILDDLARDNEVMADASGTMTWISAQDNPELKWAWNGAETLEIHA